MLYLSIQLALFAIVVLLSALVIAARITIAFRKISVRCFLDKILLSEKTGALASWIIAALLFSLIVIIDLAQF